MTKWVAVIYDETDGSFYANNFEEEQLKYFNSDGMRMVFCDKCKSEEDAERLARQLNGVITILGFYYKKGGE